MSAKKGQQGNQASLFEKFKRIPKQEYQNFFSFCIYNKKEISELDFDEYMEIKLAFIKALFHLERTHYFHKITDHFLQELLNQKSFDRHYKVIYLQVLELKAQQLKEEKRTKEAIEIYKSMVLLEPMEKNYHRKLFRSLFLVHQMTFRKYLGFATLLLIISLVTNISNQLFIAPFAPEAEGVLFTLSFILLILSVFFLLLGLLLSYVTTRKEIEVLKRKYESS